MVEAVLQLIMQMAGGTAVAAGTEVGQAVSTMVRDRLAVTDRGPAALRAVEARPDDPAAVGELRTLLQAEVDADPGFAERLAEALAAARPAHTTTGSITFQGATVRGRNVISLGSVTIRNTRNVRLSLLAAALVFVALVALGTYGGAQLIIGDDPPVPGPTATTRAQAGPGSDSPREEPTKAEPETSPYLGDAVLGESDVPENWASSGWTSYLALLNFMADEGGCDALPDPTYPGPSLGVSGAYGSGSEGIGLDLHKHDDPAEAERALDWHRTNELLCMGGGFVALPTMGDETAAYRYAEHSVVYIRDGQYLIRVMANGRLPNSLAADYARKQYEKFTKVFH
ncbi:hypothetical protein ACGFI4_31210 [Micromonospora carbonacea]|uniref:hypothetical protein n=1 Tax=Micromonospora carbonacea TaxID=47853 RepID=UPI00371B6867